MSSVSVVIPCYNYGHYLEEAVDSALTQEGVDVRVLIIDDASQDGSAEVARKIAARDPRVEAVEHTRNIGHLATYNEGLLGWADGDYSVLLSADDRLTPGALQRASALLDAHPEVGFVYGNVLWFSDAAELPTARTRYRGWSVWPGQPWLADRFRRAQSGIASPEVVVRTSAQKRVGGYDLRMPHLGDLQMWLRLAAVADVGQLRGVDQAYYRRHTQNMSTAYTPLPTLHQYRLVFESVLELYGETLPNASHLSDLVHRELAREALLAASAAYDRGQTAEVPVHELVTFAVECWPEARTLPVYRTLQLRRHIGPSVMRYLGPLTLPVAAVRKGELWWDRRQEQPFSDQLRSALQRRRAWKSTVPLRQGSLSAVGSQP